MLICVEVVLFIVNFEFPPCLLLPVTVIFVPLLLLLLLLFVPIMLIVLLVLLLLLLMLVFPTLKLGFVNPRCGRGTW